MRKITVVICSRQAWPEFDEAKTVEAVQEIGVQINGKVRATVKNCH